MNRSLISIVAVLALTPMVVAQTTESSTQVVQPASAGTPLIEKARPSLVVVQYTYSGEMGRREFSGLGVVVREDGLTIVNSELVPRQLPDEQLKEFKIILPDDEETEIAATFIGRDERYNLAYVKPEKAEDVKTPFKPLTFVDRGVAVGDTVSTIGLLPKAAGYGPYQMSARVAALLRGPVPQVLVDGGGLGVVGSPVFDQAGDAVGIITSQPDRVLTVTDRPIKIGGPTPILNDRNNPFGSIDDPTRLFVPSRDFLPAIVHAPASETDLRFPFLGVTQLTGLSKDVAEFYDLGNKVAIQVGDVIPDFSADKAGLKKGNIIVAVNGEPLERGDTPEENPLIFTRKLSRLKVGETVTLSVIAARGKPASDVKVTLEERPVQANKAKRYTAEDLGFTLRDVVFDDTYGRKLPRDTRGAVVVFIRPQSASQAAELYPTDFVTQINQTAVTDTAQFKDVYEDFRKLKPRDAVVLEVLRQGNTQIIRIEPPRE